MVWHEKQYTEDKKVHTHRRTTRTTSVRGHTHGAALGTCTNETTDRLVSSSWMDNIYHLFMHEKGHTTHIFTHITLLSLIVRRYVGTDRCTDLSRTCVSCLSSSLAVCLYFTTYYSSYCQVSSSMSFVVYRYSRYRYSTVTKQNEQSRSPLIIGTVLV